MSYAERHLLNPVWCMPCSGYRLLNCVFVMSYCGSHVLHVILEIFILNSKSGMQCSECRFETHTTDVISFMPYPASHILNAIFRQQCSGCHVPNGIFCRSSSTRYIRHSDPACRILNCMFVIAHPECHIPHSISSMSHPDCRIPNVYPTCVFETYLCNASL